MEHCFCQINTQDGYGGAAGICRTLHQEFRRRGLVSYALVGKRKGEAPFTFLVDNDRFGSLWTSFWMALANKTAKYSGKVRGAQRTCEQVLPYVATPKRWLDFLSGREDFNFPGSENILRMIPEKPDIVHLHNLHGDYFDLRVLPILTKTVPTVLTMHDLWMLTGHCAHPFGCDKWQRGCGECPDLKSPPAVRKDATHFNWERKKNLFAASRLYVVTPSQWALDKMELSILRSGAALTRLIPNGIDLNIFSPGDMGEARAQLGLPYDMKIIMFAANGIRKSPFRDFKMMIEVVQRVSSMMRNEKILFLAIGEDSPPEKEGLGEIKFIPYVKDPYPLAVYYRAADVYLHAALADVFPTVVLEALACGTPVVATSVGGILEQIVDGRTGFLTPIGDAETMAHAVMELIADKQLQSYMSRSAVQYSALHFSKQKMVDEYLSFYAEAAEDWNIFTKNLSNE